MLGDPRVSHRYLDGDPPSCPSCGSITKRIGYLRDGVTRRYRCKECGRSIQGNRTNAGGNFAPWEKVARVKELLAAGASIRSTAKAAGVSRRAVQAWLARGLVSRGAACPCGRNAGHNGWCSARLAQSAKRQAFYARFVLRQIPEEERAVTLMALRMVRNGGSPKALGVTDETLAKFAEVSHGAIDLLMLDPELAP